MEKEISVIVPVYNVKPYLCRCLDSIVTQTVFHQMEIILVDDGSSDGSGEICDNYSNRHKNIIAVHQQNGGVSVARNRGLQVATGKYLAYIDADDYVAPDMYETLLHLAYQEKADVAIVDFLVCFGSDKKYKKRNIKGMMTWSNREEAMSSFLAGKYIGINIFDKIYLRDKVKHIKFIEGRAIGEDMYYMFEVLLNVSKVCADFTPKYYYEKRQGSAMNSRFSEKYFDTLYFSELMVEKIQRSLPQLVHEAEAHAIHEQCKTVERMYLCPSDKQYDQMRTKLLNNIKTYKLTDAYRYLSKKQFGGITLMRISPKTYIRILKIMKIE